MRILIVEVQLSYDKISIKEKKDMIYFISKNVDSFFVVYIINSFFDILFMIKVCL